MSLDSAANLLFNIGANTDDAESNIKRFRTLLGKDLSDLSEEFSDWAQDVLGDLSTVQGAMTAGVAGIGAAAAGAVAMLNEAANKYFEFVGQIAQASKATGIAAEQMSGLHFAANATGTSMESLTHGLTLFEVATQKANAGSQQQAQAFHSLGITQAQVAAGEKDILPLLGLVMDRFQGLASGTERAAVARELFGRGGSEMIAFLRLGSEGLKHFTEKAKEMGLTVGKDDVEAMRRWTATSRELEEHAEAFTIAWGKQVAGIKQWLAEFKIATVEVATDAPLWKKALSVLPGGALLFSKGIVNDMQHVREEIKKTTDMLAKPPGNEHLDLNEPTQAVEKLKENYAGLSSILERVNERMAAGQGEYEKVASEITHLAVEVMHAREEYSKLVAEGKLSADDAKSQAAALNALPAAILNLWTQLRQQLDAKRREADQKAKEEAQVATSDLVKRIQDQHEKGIEAQEAEWNDEINKLVASYQKKGQLTSQNEAMLAELREQGLFRIHRDQLTAFSEELLDLQKHLASIREANMDSTEKLKLQQDIELDDFRRVEQEKIKVAKEGTQERKILEDLYQQNLKELLAKQAADLRVLENSQGWQGVLGSKFADLIKGNEALSREWAQSATQNLMMVRVTMEGLQETGTKLFESMSQGMSGAIANAIVYKKSIGEAMEAAMASTLESLAGQAITYGIYATALGFLDLAEGNYEAAGNAFTSAAIWGTVGAAAGIAGRAMTPSSAASGGAGGLGTQAAAMSAYGANNQAIPAQQQRGGVNVYIAGHVIGNSGVSELAGMLNDAVLGQDVTLTATNTRTGVQVTR
jgi:hypothetical protein